MKYECLFIDLALPYKRLRGPVLESP